MPSGRPEKCGVAARTSLRPSAAAKRGACGRGRALAAAAPGRALPPSRRAPAGPMLVMMIRRMLFLPDLPRRFGQAACGIAWRRGCGTSKLAS